MDSGLESGCIGIYGKFKELDREPAVSLSMFVTGIWGRTFQNITTGLKMIRVLRDFLINFQVGFIVNP